MNVKALAVYLIVLVVILLTTDGQARATKNPQRRSHDHNSPASANAAAASGAGGHQKRRTRPLAKNRKHPYPAPKGSHSAAKQSQDKVDSASGGGVGDWVIGIGNDGIARAGLRDSSESGVLRGTEILTTPRSEVMNPKDCWVNETALELQYQEHVKKSIQKKPKYGHEKIAPTTDNTSRGKLQSYTRNHSSHSVSDRSLCPWTTEVLHENNTMRYPFHLPVPVVTCLCKGDSSCGGSTAAIPYQCEEVYYSVPVLERQLRCENGTAVFVKTVVRVVVGCTSASTKVVFD